jgi:hypothetical protein
MRKNAHGTPAPISMGKSNKAHNKKDEDWFHEHTIIVEPSVGIYIDRVLQRKNGCLILNPASHF